MSPAPTPPDADLVALALRGDGDAFDVLVRRYYRAAGRERVCFCARGRPRGVRFGSRSLTRCEPRATREFLATRRARLREPPAPTLPSIMCRVPVSAPCAGALTRMRTSASPGRASAFAPQGPVAAVCHGPAVGRWHTDATCRPEGANALARPRARLRAQAKKRGEQTSLGCRAYIIRLAGAR